MEYQTLYNKLVENLYYPIETKKLNELEKMMKENKRFFVLGSGRTGYVCEFFSSVFNDNKPFSSFVIGDRYKIESLKDGLLIAASGSGKTPYVISRLQTINKKVNVVSLTANETSPISSLSNKIITIKDKRQRKKKYNIDGDIQKHLPLTLLGTSFELKLMTTLMALNDYYFRHSQNIKKGYKYLVDSLKSNLDERKISELTELLIKKRNNRIFITGHYQCGIVSNYIINRWKNLGFKLTNPRSAESPRMKKEDLVLIISGSGQEYLNGEKGFEHYYYKYIYDICEKRNVEKALITSNTESSLALNSDLVVPIKGRDYLKRILPKKSTDYLFEMKTMLLEAVITHKIAEKLNITESQMKENHSDFV